MSGRNRGGAGHLPLIASLCLLSSGGRAAASPCDNVQRTLAPSDRTAFAAAIAPQLRAPSVDVLDSFHLGPWRIFYVDSKVADEAFVFFSSDPRASHYVTLWSGGATPAEETNIRHWVGVHAPGIPDDLAACFAWHVTKDPSR